MFIWKLAEKYTSPVSVIRRMYSMTISQSELNTWNFTWLACWLFQATSAGGEWPTYLQWFPAAWAFPGWGAAVLRRGGWDHTHSPMAPRTRGFLTQHRKQEQEKDQLSRKKAPHPSTSLTMVLFKHHQSYSPNLTSVQPAVRNLFSY